MKRTHQHILQSKRSKSGLLDAIDILDLSQLTRNAAQIKQIQNQDSLEQANSLSLLCIMKRTQSILQSLESDQLRLVQRRVNVQTRDGDLRECSVSELMLISDYFRVLLLSNEKHLSQVVTLDQCSTCAFDIMIAVVRGDQKPNITRFTVFELLLAADAYLVDWLVLPCYFSLQVELGWVRYRVKLFINGGTQLYYQGFKELNEVLINIQNDLFYLERMPRLLEYIQGVRSQLLRAYATLIFCCKALDSRRQLAAVASFPVSMFVELLRSPLLWEKQVSALNKLQCFNQYCQAKYFQGLNVFQQLNEQQQSQSQWRSQGLPCSLCLQGNQDLAQKPEEIASSSSCAVVERLANVYTDSFNICNSCCQELLNIQQLAQPCCVDSEISTMDGHQHEEGDCELYDDGRSSETDESETSEDIYRSESKQEMVQLCKVSFELLRGFGNELSSEGDKVHSQNGANNYRPVEPRQDDTSSRVVQRRALLAHAKQHILQLFIVQKLSNILRPVSLISWLQGLAPLVLNRSRQPGGHINAPARIGQQ